MRSSSRLSLKGKIKIGVERLFQQYRQKARACGRELSFAETQVVIGTDDLLSLDILEHRA
jgi:hypothetical protein